MQRQRGRGKRGSAPPSRRAQIARGSEGAVHETPSTPARTTATGGLARAGAHASAACFFGAAKTKTSPASAEHVGRRTEPDAGVAQSVGWCRPRGGDRGVEMAKGPDSPVRAALAVLRLWMQPSGRREGCAGRGSRTVTSAAAESAPRDSAQAHQALVLHPLLARRLRRRRRRRRAEAPWAWA